MVNHAKYPDLDPEGRPVATTSFAAVAPKGRPGPIRVSRDNPRLLAHADGTPFIAIGPNLAWATGRDRIAAFTSSASDGFLRKRITLPSLIAATAVS